MQLDKETERNFDRISTEELSVMNMQKGSRAPHWEKMIFPYFPMHISWLSCRTNVLHLAFHKESDDQDQNSMIV